MTAEQFRKAVGFISSKPQFIDLEKIKCQKIIFNRILELESDLAKDNEKMRAVFKIQSWENLKARIYYSRLNLELNKVLLESLK